MPMAAVTSDGTWGFMGTDDSTWATIYDTAKYPNMDTDYTDDAGAANSFATWNVPNGTDPVEIGRAHV